MAGGGFRERTVRARARVVDSRGPLARELLTRPLRPNHDCTSSAGGTVMRRLAIGMLATLVMLAAGTPHFTRPAAAQGDRPEVHFTVNGLGRVTLEPDFAVLVFSIETIGTTPQAAMRDNATRIETLLKHLREVTKPGDRVETAGFRLSAQRRGRSGPPP